MIDFAALKDQITFITGSARGVGKTTLLNYLAKRMRTLGPVCIAAIGADEKPLGSASQGAMGGARIEVKAGDLVITSQAALASSAGLFRIIDEMGRRTALGRIVCAQVLRGCQLAMIGPETNTQMAGFLATCTARHGARTLLIDGALHRLTQVAALPSCGFIEVIKVDGASLGAATRRLNFLARMDLCTLWESKMACTLPHAHQVHGALTAEKLSAIPADGQPIVVEDLTKIFLSEAALAKLPLMVRCKIPLRAVVLNPWGVPLAQLNTMMAASTLAERMLLSPFMLEEE